MKACAGRGSRTDDRQQEAFGGHAVVGKKPHMANGNAASMHTQPTSAAPMSGFKPKYAPTATPMASSANTICRRDKPNRMLS